MPDRFTPIQATNLEDVVRQINRNFQIMDGEGTTKKFNGPNGTASMVQGRYATDRYGIVFYESGVARILIGQAPDDGRMGVWVSREDEDVIELLGG